MSLPIPTLFLSKAHSPLLAFIHDYIADKQSKSTYLIMDDFPDLGTINETVIFGVYSWYLPSKKERWLLREACYIFDGIVCSRNDIVRAYLSYYHNKKRRATGLEARAYEKPAFAPLYIRPSTILDSVYIDIKSTYYSICQVIGWDCQYMPNLWLIAGRAPLDFPLPLDKSARNYLISIGNRSTMSIWTNGKFTTKPSFNTFINLSLVHAVMDILHSIASIAVSLGAVYVHTDGYIVPASSQHLLLSEIKKWGLTATIKESGVAIVNGFGNYRIGEKRTRMFNVYSKSEPYSSINKTDVNWLLKSVRELIKRDDAYRLYAESLSF
jgi:hypothetical protein